MTAKFNPIWSDSDRAKEYALNNQERSNKNNVTNTALEPAATQATFETKSDSQ